MELVVEQATLHCKSRLPYEMHIVEIRQVVGAGELSEVIKYKDPNSSITVACEKYCEIPIVDDLYMMETAYLGRYKSVFKELKTFMPKFMKIYTNYLRLLNNFTILKQSFDYKEYEIYFGFMVSSTDLHAVFKTEKSYG
ncbi:hypothetical protein AVEN_238120-1 [Araneus ventricosus]|uniref:Uncharacterized protein n=1 Tax=Araneus ventricosus TaxID=182803 RepID=A0A4Y2JW19_ARAVE|nr:hypothetical protein AVEN_230153-1 [Araneus ventricosus]GBM93719.1 hypothetical protein AVEN_238120-1 [Araneus ventricosus]